MFMQYICDCQMQMKFSMHRRVFVALAARKYHKNSYRTALFVTFKEKGRKLDKVNQIFANFHLESAKNFYCTLIYIY